eukprot:PhM_4_TR4338/c0_g1_i1/m.19588/K12946/SPCS1; signal peptidase complex subunit 1
MSSLVRFADRLVSPMSPKGQRLGEHFIRVFLPLMGAVGFVLGIVAQSFFVTVMVVGAAAVVTLLVVVPNWPCLYPALDSDDGMAPFVSDAMMQQYIEARQKALDEHAEMECEEEGENTANNSKKKESPNESKKKK